VTTTATKMRDILSATSSKPHYKIETQFKDYKFPMTSKAIVLQTKQEINNNMVWIELLKLKFL